MQNGIHFISGLPRSGSTLLAGILRQNPKLQAGMSSPVGALFNALLNSMGAMHEHAVFIEEEQRRDVLRGVFDGYYRKIHQDKLVFDTNRLWCSRMAALASLFPELRVIACVRDPVKIIDSFERLIRKNALLVSRMFPAEANATVFTRVDHLTAKHGTVGFAWNALQEAFYGEFSNRLILVDYEALARDPKRTLSKLYDLLNFPFYAHDFENVTYDGGENSTIGSGSLVCIRSARRFDLPRPNQLFRQRLFGALPVNDFGMKKVHPKHASCFLTPLWYKLLSPRMP